MAKYTERTNVLLSKRVSEELEKIAKDMHTTKASLIRDALETSGVLSGDNEKKHDDGINYKVKNAIEELWRKNGISKEPINYKELVEDGRKY